MVYSITSRDKYSTGTSIHKKMMSSNNNNTEEQEVTTTDMQPISLEYKFKCDTCERIGTALELMRCSRCKDRFYCNRYDELAYNHVAIHVCDVMFTLSYFYWCSKNFY